MIRPAPSVRLVVGTAPQSQLLRGWIGDLLYSFHWTGADGEEVNATITGRILSPWFGNALIAPVSCYDFGLSLAPTVRRTVLDFPAPDVSSEGFTITQQLVRLRM